MQDSRRECIFAYVKDSIDKKYYRISEVSELLGEPASTLRFWERYFPRLKPERTATGRRLYTPAQLHRLRMIQYLLRTRGLKIEAALAELRSNPTGVSRHTDALTRLTEIRNRLTALIDSIK